MDDERLLAAAAAGDAEAYAQFYQRHLALVVAFSLRAARDREAAADLTGEVFAAALAASARYTPIYDSAGPWLLGIANNKLRESERRGRVQDAVRRKLQMRPLELGDEDLERVEELASGGGTALLEAVDALPPDEREAVRARVIEERDYRDVAGELRCSESVVRQRVSRGLKRIRARVSEEESA